MQQQSEITLAVELGPHFDCADTAIKWEELNFERDELVLKLGELPAGCDLAAEMIDQRIRELTEVERALLTGAKL
jgi:hypothetical protein